MNQLALMLIFVPLMADTLSTVVARTAHGHHPFTPHCQFHYQRMILSGMPHRRVLLLHWLAVLLWGYLGLLL